MSLDALKVDRRKKGYTSYTNPEEVTKRNYLPEPEGDQKFYMVSLSSKCPRNELSFLGITFARGQTTAKTSTTEYPKSVAVFTVLAENQKKAIEIFAKTKFVIWREAVKDKDEDVDDDRKSYQTFESPYSDFIQLSEFPIGKFKNIEQLEDVMNKAFDFSGTKENLADQKKHIAQLKEILRRQEEIAKKMETADKGEIVEQELKEIKNSGKRSSKGLNE